MTIVDWAHVVLPLLVLVVGGLLMWRHWEAFDAWVNRLIGH